MAETQAHLTEGMTDAQTHAFYRDAAAIVEAESELERAMADLVQAPFDAAAQQQLASYLTSEELQQATEAARRIGGVN